MICIEEQSIVTLWGCLRFCQIINGMSFWATRILKPKVSMYIDQWRLRHFQDFKPSLSRDQVLFETVRKIEERERQIGLYRSSNLAEIVRMTLMIQEISSVDAEIRSKRDSPSEGKESDAPPNQPQGAQHDAPPNQPQGEQPDASTTPVPYPLNTPLGNSGRKISTRSTRGSKKTPTRGGKRTPRLAAATLPQSTPTKIQTPFHFGGGSPAIQVDGTRVAATISSSTRSTPTYSATELPSSTFSPEISTAPQKLSVQNGTNFSTMESSEIFGEVPKFRLPSTASGGEVATASTAKSNGVIADFLSRQPPRTELYNFSNSFLTADEPARVNKDSNVSSGWSTMEDNTDILDSEWDTNEVETSDDERSSEIIADVLLFRWCKEL